MIDCGKAPENQMALPFMGGEDERLMGDIRKWAVSHISEFSWYKRFALDQGDKASPNFCLQAMRNRFKVSVPNAYAPGLARIAMEEDPRLSFRLAKSRLDGFCKVKL